MTDLLKELTWRGLIHDVMPGTETLLKEGQIAGYVGFDPTADSLHVGNMVPMMLLVHLQRAGHKPIALVGGATGMVGDPSGKSDERKLLDSATLNHNVACIKKQLEKFLDFESGKAEIVNNYDWFKEYKFLDFLRDVGKHLTVNYMLAKDSVKNRIETGISFTEFSYQLIQGYDYLHLYRHHGCKLQMGGSDQWGNITSGTELIRRMDGGEAFALTAPLLTKSDGTKFGKSEGGNIWLDPKKTSPYAFYQFWINASDEDVSKLIRIFTLLDEPTILDLESRHSENPASRLIQRTLAHEITLKVHGEIGLKDALLATSFFFGEKNSESLLGEWFNEVMRIAPTFSKEKEYFDDKELLDILIDASVFPSKSEARRMFQSGGLKINYEKPIALETKLEDMVFLENHYLIVQKGKKNFHIIRKV
jgi:tyrosyl-tRNA synthetase